MVERMPEMMIVLSEFGIDSVKEPLFINFSLHNTKTRERISEDYNAILDESMKQLEVGSIPPTDSFFDIIRWKWRGSGRCSMSTWRIRMTSKMSYYWSRYLDFWEAPPSQTTPISSPRWVHFPAKTSTPEISLKFHPQISKKDAESFKLSVEELVQPRTSKGQPLVQCLWGVTSLFDEAGKVSGSVLNPLGTSPGSKDGGGYTSRKFQVEMRAIKPGTIITNEQVRGCGVREGVMTSSQAYDFQPETMLKVISIIITIIVYTHLDHSHPSISIIRSTDHLLYLAHSFPEIQSFSRQITVGSQDTQIWPQRQEDEQQQDALQRWSLQRWVRDVPRGRNFRRKIRSVATHHSVQWLVHISRECHVETAEWGDDTGGSASTTRRSWWWWSDEMT